jgi:hypothetical protein
VLDVNLTGAFLCLKHAGAAMAGSGDVARLIRFLAGPESDWITGQCISVDGGHHLRRGPDIALGFG